MRPPLDRHSGNGRQRGNAIRAKVPFLLKGIAFGTDGRALTPWFTRKKSGRLYRYYLPTRENKEHAGASGLPRLPAAEWRRCWSSCAVSCARRGGRRGDSGGPTRSNLDEAQVTVAMTRLDNIWDQLFPAEQQRIVRLLIEKVIVSPNDIEVRLRQTGIEELAFELRPAVPEEVAA